jgi:hypothetical protein
MNRSRKLLLLGVLFALQAHALPARAGDAACRDIAVANPSQPILLRNASARPVTLSLRFDASARDSLSCGTLTVAPGGDTGDRTLASFCPTATSAGTLKACAAPVVVHARRGTPTGDLLADLQSNNLDAAGR